MKLNLGAWDRHIPDFRCVDIAPPPCAICGAPESRTVDLTKPWTWADSSVAEVLAYDVFEHLPDKRHTMNELWRVLVPGGIARIQVPHGTEGDGGVCDPTHVSLWSTSDFEYYHPGIAERERFRNSPYYGVKADFKVIEMRKQRYERHWGGYVVEIQAVLEAVK